MDENEFQTWYRSYAKRLGLNPNPDDPRHHYDYRAAFKAGARPDNTGHWPSEFKDDTHPWRFLKINGKLTDTKTGKIMADKEMKFKEDKIKAKPKASDSVDRFSKKMGWSPEETAKFVSQRGAVGDEVSGSPVKTRGMEVTRSVKTPRGDVKELTDALVSAWRQSGGASEAHPAADAMATLPAYTYKYKEPYAEQYGQGTKLGPMAQDMEKNPVTAQAVITGGDGLKRVDTGRLSLANTAALSDLARKVKEIEAGTAAMNRENTMSGEELDQYDELSAMGDKVVGAMPKPRVGEQDLAELRAAIQGLREEMPQGGSDPLARTEPQAPPTARFPDLVAARKPTYNAGMLSDIRTKRFY